MTESGKLMKIISKKIVMPVVWVLIAVTLLGGCVPKRYSTSQEEGLVQACLPAVNEFLAEHCGEYELGEFHLHEVLLSRKILCRALCEQCCQRKLYRSGKYMGLGL